MYLRILIYCYLSLFAMTLPAQQPKSVLLTDIRNTMADFIAELNLFNDDDSDVEYNAKSIAATFGSTNYLLVNGQPATSFETWIKDYALVQLNGKPVTHNLKILDNTVRKKDTENTKRYIFEGILERTPPDNSFKDVYTSWVVKWNGEGRNVTILEINFINDDLKESIYAEINRLKEKLTNLSDDEHVRFNQLVEARAIHEKILLKAEKYNILYEVDNDYKTNIQSMFDKWVKAGDNLPIPTVKINCYRNALKMKEDLAVRKKLNELL